VITIIAQTLLPIGNLKGFSARRTQVCIKMSIYDVLSLHYIFAESCPRSVGQNQTG
jgi:hypothetical protein